MGKAPVAWSMAFHARERTHSTAPLMNSSEIVLWMPGTFSMEPRFRPSSAISLEYRPAVPSARTKHLFLEITKGFGRGRASPMLTRCLPWRRAPGSFSTQMAGSPTKIIARSRAGLQGMAAQQVGSQLLRLLRSLNVLPKQMGQRIIFWLPDKRAFASMTTRQNISGYTPRRVRHLIPRNPTLRNFDL